VLGAIAIAAKANAAIISFFMFFLLWLFDRRYGDASNTVLNF